LNFEFYKFNITKRFIFFASTRYSVEPDNFFGYHWFEERNYQPNIIDSRFDCSILFSRVAEEN